MGLRLKFALWLGALFGSAVALVAVVDWLLATGLPPHDQAVLARILEERGPLLAFVALIVLIACAGVLRWLFARFVAPLRGIAEQAVIIATANIGHRVATDAGPEAAELARAINRLGDAYRAQHGDMDARVAEASASLEEERNRLAALMSELSEGVLVCNEQGRILLYNEQARSLFAPAAGSPDAANNPVGLGRPIFTFLDRHQVAHAMEKIRDGLARDSRDPVTMFFTSAAGEDLVRVRFAPFLSTDGRIAGLVLTCDDVTKALGQESQRRSLLQALATRVRQPAANVRAAAENLTAFPDMAEADRRRFAEIIAAESKALSDTLDAALREYADALHSDVSLEDMRLADLLNVARRRIDLLPGLRATADGVDESLWVRVDSYAFAQLLHAFATRLHEDNAVTAIAFRASARGGFAEIDLAWSGAALPREALQRWETLPIQVGAEQAPLTARQVLERHGSELWQEPDAKGGEPAIRMLVPLAEPQVARAPRRLSPGARPEFYDFDLFRLADSARTLLGKDLTRLSYTVFDTETTGVEPSAGDKIISLGAIRIVNGRALRQEIFQQLVDPRRSIPRDSIRIHGLRPDDLRGQPTLDKALPAFHRFCEDTVLVAHNAAFDMRFLELAEPETGVRFTQPVLDTLLLSAVVHRNQPDHSLEAIAARLGVDVVGRHTALGDAMVTGEIFLKLLPLLAERGIVSLGQALEAPRETWYVRVQY